MPGLRIHLSQEAYDQLRALSTRRGVEPWVAGGLLLESRLIGENRHDAIATYAEMQRRRSDKAKP